MDDHADRWDGAHEEEPCGESETGGVIIVGFSHLVPDIDPQEIAEWPDFFDVALETRGRSGARFSVGQATTDDEFVLEEAGCLMGRENAQYVTVIIVSSARSTPRASTSSRSACARVALPAQWPLTES